MDYIKYMIIYEKRIMVKLFNDESKMLGILKKLNNDDRIKKVFEYIYIYIQDKNLVKTGFNDIAKRDFMSNKKCINEQENIQASR